MTQMTTTRTPPPPQIDYRVIFDTAGNGLLVTLADSGQILEANQAWLGSFAIRHEQAIGQSVIELGIWAHAHERDACRAELERHGSVTEREVSLIGRNAQLPYLISARTIDVGGARQVLWDFRDITQRKLTELRMLASEEKYRGIFDEAVTAIYVFDNAKRFVDSNQAGLDLLGYNREELLCLSIPDVDVDPLAVQPAHAHLREGGRLVNFEHKLRRKDGSVVTVLNNSRPLSSPLGEVVGMQSTLVDITELKRLDAELKQTREGLEGERALLKTLVRTIPNLVWLKDTQGVYLACNAEFERFFGHSEAEIVGKTDFDFLPAELAQFFRDHDRAAMAAGKPTVNEEWITYASDGHRAFLVTTKTPMYRPDGGVIGVLGVAHDITEMRRQEEALRESQETLERAQAVANVGSWRLDIASSRLVWSDEAYRIFGIPIGAPVTLEGFLSSIHPDDQERVGAAWSAALKGTPYDVEHRILVGDRVRWVRERAIVVRDDSGAELRGLGTVQDVTEQRQAAHQLAQSQALLRNVLDAVPVRIFWKDRQCRYLGCNPIFARDAGKTNPNEVVGKLDDDMGWADQADLYRADDHQVMASGVPRLNFEEPQTTPDGHTIYLRTSKVPLRDEQGDVFGVLGIYDDITQRRQTEDQLKESEERFRALFNASRDAIYLHDGPTIVDCNPAALTLLGKTDRSDIVGMTPARRAAPDTEDAREAAARSAERITAALAGDPQQFEWPARKSDGNEVLLDVQLTRVDIGGRAYVQAIARDITERKKAEAVLREERLLRDTIQDAIPGVSYAMDANGEFVFWSRSFEQVTGRSADELAHFNALDLFEGEGQIQIAERIRRTFVDGASDAEADLVAKDGRRTPYFFTGRRIEWKGQPILVGAGVDMSERKLALARLQESEARFRHLFESSPDAAWILQGHRFMHANTAAIRLFQRTVEADFVDTHPADLSPLYQPDGEASTIKAERLMQEADRLGVLRFEWVHQRADGSLFDTEVTLATMNIAQKGVIYAVVRDITARKATENALRQLTADLEARVLQKTADLQASYLKLRDTEFAMDSVGIGIHWVDSATGRFVHVNQFAAAILGYTCEELLQLRVQDIDPHFQEAAFREINERICQLGFLKFETEQLRRDGTRIPVEMTVYHHPQPDGTSRMISFMLDITERKRTEMALQEAKTLAESATAAKSAFLANMSHEIRTPLNAILGISYLMHQESLTAAQRSKLDKIEVSGRHLLSLINDILDLSKIEAGKLIINHDNFHLSSVLDNVASIIKDSALEKGLDLDLDPDGVPVWLWGDATRLRQALLNFAGNAVKFTSQGAIHLRALLLEERAGQLQVRFEVADSGIGISPEQQAQLFQDFVQADGTTARQYGGTGLGLSLTLRLIELMGGKVGVESVAGHGSTFWFEVPLERGHGPIPVTRKVESQQAVEWGLRTHHRGTRILLAEDNEFNAEIVVELLHATGMDVTVAVDGREAVELARREVFALALMDMQMPRMTGLEATRQIRTLAGWQAVPILALTANAFTDDRQACLDAGMNDVLTKPVEPPQLYAALQTWLSTEKKAATAKPLSVGTSVQADHPAVWEHLASLNGIDTDAGLRMLRGNQVKYIELLTRFAASMHGRIAQTRQHVDNGQQDEARLALHSIKGTAANLGLKALSAEAAQLETSMREPGWLASHRDQVSKTMAAMDDWVANLESALGGPDGST
jgi:two-component system sensor histidine kinase/response regulator